MLSPGELNGMIPEPFPVYAESFVIAQFFPVWNCLWVAILTGKKARGKQRKTFMDWLSFACGERWKSKDILKIRHERNEHKLIASVRI